MIPVLNRPFLEHTIAYLKKYQVEDIILTVSYLPQAIQDYFGDGRNLGVRLTYTVEDSPLGTAGAIKNAERYLDGTFVVLNGDVFTDLNVADMLAFHQAKGAKATIALTRVDNPCAFGMVETGGDGRVQRFIEKPSPDRVTTHWINAGVYILEPEVLGHVPADSFYMFEKGLFPLLLELGKPVHGYPFSGYWIDMGTPAKCLQLNCDLLGLAAKSALIENLSGVSYGEDVAIHPSVEIVGPVIIGSRCTISQGARITGPAAIGSDCYIGENARIERTVIWSGGRVGAGATLRQCIVGHDATIAGNARVIECTVVGDQEVMKLS
jgi:mannose-1-phosphate guanylyltransferase